VPTEILICDVVLKSVGGEVYPMGKTASLLGSVTSV